MREQLAAALNSSRCTSGSTHNFYLYPSRFSPEIARTIITLFSQPGDSVLAARGRSLFAEPRCSGNLAMSD